MDATAAIPPEAGDLPLPPADEPDTELLTAQPGLDPAEAGLQPHHPPRACSSRRSKSRTRDEASVLELTAQ